MRKFQELQDAGSCLNRAGAQELLFVLMGRDVAAPAVVRYWAEERIRLGKNTTLDEQITQALALAKRMEEDQQNRGLA